MLVWLQRLSWARPTSFLPAWLLGPFSEQLRVPRRSQSLKRSTLKLSALAWSSLGLCHFWSDTCSRWLPIVVVLHGAFLLWMLLISLIAQRRCVLCPLVPHNFLLLRRRGPAQRLLLVVLLVLLLVVQQRGAFGVLLCTMLLSVPWRTRLLRQQAQCVRHCPISRRSFRRLYWMRLCAPVGSSPLRRCVCRLLHLQALHLLWRLHHRAGTRLALTPFAPTRPPTHPHMLPPSHTLPSILPSHWHLRVHAPPFARTSVYSTSVCIVPPHPCLCAHMGSARHGMSGSTLGCPFTKGSLAPPIATCTSVCTHLCVHAPSGASCLSTRASAHT